MSDGASKVDHYKVICISLYNENLSELDAAVASLKAKGITKASRSSLIRYALRVVSEEHALGPDGIRRELSGPPMPDGDRR